MNDQPTDLDLELVSRNPEILRETTEATKLEQGNSLCSVG